MRAPRCRYRCRQSEHRRLPALHRRSPGVQAVLLPGLRIADRKRSRTRERSGPARYRVASALSHLPMNPPRTPRDRVPYSAIVDRPGVALPGDARMVGGPIVNGEDGGIERPIRRTVLSPPMGQPLSPDLPNWAWHEYGMRVGFWRLLECMQKFGVTPTLAINGVVCRNYPRIAQAARDLGWEFMGHGWLQTTMHKG